MLLCLLLLFCDLMSVNSDWSIILIRKSFGASRHISEKLGVKLAIPLLPKSPNSSLKPSSVVVQLGLCRI